LTIREDRFEGNSMIGRTDMNYSVTGPLVTVIIPAFNAGKTLSATVESVLAQTYDRLQVLIVNDGSTDETADIAARFARADPRVSVLSKKNGGVALARNLGLAQAKGAYTAWLDADDLWHPTKIARQLDVFKASDDPLSFVYTGYRQIDDDDKVIVQHRVLTEVTGFTPCRQIATNFFSNVSSIMVPTSLAKKVGGHDPNLRDAGVEGAEDFLFQLQLSMLGSVGCCRQALVGYRMHDRNMSLNFARAGLSNIRALDLVWEMGKDLPEWVFRLGRARVVGFVPFAIRQGDIAGAWRVFAALMRGQPKETLAMMVQILAHVTRNALTQGAPHDPAIGQTFGEADPASAPWQDHMLLSQRQRRRLDALDRNLAQAQRKEKCGEVREARSNP
jgi:glycosyltransferase involved in cell wall biosynthesis